MSTECERMVWLGFCFDGRKWNHAEVMRDKDTTAQLGVETCSISLQRGGRMLTGILAGKVGEENLVARRFSFFLPVSSRPHH